MHLSMVVPTHPTWGDPRSQGGDCPASRSPRGGTLVRTVEVFFCCQPLGWCSHLLVWEFTPKLCPRGGGKCFSKVTIPTSDLGRPEVGEVGTTTDKCIMPNYGHKMFVMNSIAEVFHKQSLCLTYSLVPLIHYHT